VESVKQLDLQKLARIIQLADRFEEAFNDIIFVVNAVARSPAAVA